MKQRLLWMDLLNITAIIGVMMMHVNLAQNEYNGQMTFPFIWGVGVHSLFIWPVDVFYMLTGANLIGRSMVGGCKMYAEKRFKRTVIPFVVWSLIYWAIYSRTTNPVEFIDGFVNTKFCAYLWFFIPLFGIYLAIPFVESLVVKSSRRKVELFLICAFLVDCCLYTACQLLDIHDLNNLFPIAGRFFWFAILGYYLKTFDIDVKVRKWLYFAGVVAVIVNFCCYILINYLQNSPNIIFRGYHTPTCVLIASTVFVWFKYFKWEHLSKYSHTIMFVSSCTLGVYLMHRLTLSIFNMVHMSILEHFTFGFIPVYLFTLLLVVIFKKIPYLRDIIP